MNPATDVGKRTLLPSIRSRFTEFYVNEPVSQTDLTLIINQYLGEIPPNVIRSILEIYNKIKHDLAKSCLVDGNNKRPVISLRVLCRSLFYTAQLVRKSVSLIRAVYEGLNLAFLSGLDTKSQEIVENLISQVIITNVKESVSSMKQLDSRNFSKFRFFDRKYILKKFLYCWDQHYPL